MLFRSSIFLLGLKVCRLRFASFGIRAQVLKSVLLSFYILFLVIILSCSFCVYDTGDRADYLRTIVKLACEREDLGPGLREWLEIYVAKGFTD